MGTHYKKAIFDEHVQVGLIGWAQKAKKKKGPKADASNGRSGQGSSNNGSTPGVELGAIFRRASAPEDIQTAQKSEGAN